MFTFKQQVFAVSSLAVTGNARESARQFEVEFGKPVPDHKTIIRWKEKLDATGNLASNQKGQGRPVTASGDEATQLVLSTITADNQTSTRRLSNETGISRSSVRRIIKKSGVKNWKPKVTQKLNDGDKDRRMEFAQKMLASIAMNGSFLSNIIFADEATFHVSGLVNRHNCYYYSQEDPSIIWEKPVNSPSVCVWAALGR